jgi:acetolactate synthase I/II/III large subunit
METMSGAQILLALLERQGITTIAGIPGGANLPMYDALQKSRVIRHVLARHEQGAGFIAQGMARSTGKPAVCFATSGPGVTNILTAIADAYLDSIPVICITGQVPRSMIGTDAFQEVDTYGMTIPITKHNFLIRSIDEMFEVIPRAFKIATSGRPGPVLVDIPKDVQSATMEFESWPEPGKPDTSPKCDQGELQKAVEMIDSAVQPILYLGGGGISSGAADIARQFAEKTSIPITVTLMGLGAIPADHPLALGMLGMHAARSTNIALEECDLLIAAGVRFDDRATGKVSEFCPRAKVIHLDIDPSEVSKLKVANAALLGDVKENFEALLPRVQERQRHQWLGKIADWQKQYPLTIPSSLVPQKPYGLIGKVASLLDKDAFITTDVGKHQMWTAQVFPFSFPRQFLTSGGLGTMGFGLPAAIGASLAFPYRQVVCFTGDGSFQMNIQELATAVEQKTNIKIIVLNNNSLGLVRQQQGLFYEKNHFACDFQIDIDFELIARGYGVKAFNLADDPAPEKTLAMALSESGPCLVNVPIGKDEEVYPMVPPGAANKTMIGGYNAKECA